MSAERILRTLDARGLDGARYALPGDLPRPLNLLMIAFRREQQEVVDGWLPALLPVESDDVGVYEVPVLPSLLGPVRWWIDGGMRGGIPDLAARARTLTVYTDVGKVQSDLGLAGSGEIAVVLVDRTGTILAQQVGGWEPEKAAALLGALPGD